MRASSPSFLRRAGTFAGWGVLILLLGYSFCLDFENTARGGAIDLRNRMTGVRLLVHHLDPYFYKWHKGDPPEYCDPYSNPLLPMSKTTATPTLLLLHLPFGILPYRLGQFLWFFAQWFFLLGTAFLWWRRLAATRLRLWFALFVVGFTYTDAWRLHAERGQVYVLLLFLLACWLRTTLDDKPGRRFLTGFLAGFLVTVRLPFLLLAPFLALHRRGQLAGAGVGLLFGLGLPMLWEPGCWASYASAMHDNSVYYRSDIQPHAPLHLPGVIEGTRTEILVTYLPIPYGDSSIHGLLRRMGEAPFPVAPVFLLGLIPFAVWTWWSRRQRIENVLTGLAGWLFLIDFFLPAYRNSYDDVLVLNVVALGLIASRKLSPVLWPSFLALAAGWGVYCYVWDQVWLINLPTLLFTTTCVLALFLFNNRSVIPKVETAC